MMDIVIKNIDSAVDFCQVVYELSKKHSYKFVYVFLISAGKLFTFLVPDNGYNFGMHMFDILGLYKNVVDECCDYYCVP